MKKYAVILNNKVSNIIVADDEFVDNNELQAIDVTDKECYIGQSVVDGQLADPENPVIVTMRQYLEEDLKDVIIPKLEQALKGIETEFTEQEKAAIDAAYLAQSQA